MTKVGAFLRQPVVPVVRDRLLCFYTNQASGRSDWPGVRDAAGLLAPHEDAGGTENLDRKLELL